MRTRLLKNVSHFHIKIKAFFFFFYSFFSIWKDSKSVTFAFAAKLHKFSFLKSCECTNLLLFANIMLHFP